MVTKSKNTGLIIAIVFAAIAISGSLIFFGVMQSQNSANDVVTVKIGDADKTRMQKEKFENNKTLDVKKVSKTYDHIRGNVDAPVSLIEYSDFECPFCKQFHPTAQQIVDEYDGKVNWVYRHFPLSFHNPLATREALASECANELGGNDAFWKYADMIFETTTSNGRGMQFDDLISIAAKLNLDETSFRECLESEKYLDRIKQDLSEGRKAGVKGTPGNIVINNETGESVFLSGAQPFYKFKLEIDNMLEKE